MQNLHDQLKSCCYTQWLARAQMGLQILHEWAWSVSQAFRWRRHSADAPDPHHTVTAQIKSKGLMEVCSVFISQGSWQIWSRKLGICDQDQKNAKLFKITEIYGTKSKVSLFSDHLGSISPPWILALMCGGLCATKVKWFERIFLDGLKSENTNTDISICSMCCTNKTDIATHTCQGGAQVLYCSRCHVNMGKVTS